MRIVVPVLTATAALGWYLTPRDASSAPPAAARQRVDGLGLTTTLPTAYRKVCAKQAAFAPARARTCPPIVPAGPMRIQYAGSAKLTAHGAGGFDAELSSRSISTLGARRIETNGGHWSYSVWWGAVDRKRGLRLLEQPQAATRPSRCGQVRLHGEPVKSCRVVPWEQGGGLWGGHFAYVWMHSGTTYLVSARGYANEPRVSAIMSALIVRARRTT